MIFILTYKIKVCNCESTGKLKCFQTETVTPFDGEYFVPKLEDLTYFRGLTNENL